MGYFAVFLLMGGSAVVIKYFVDRGSGDAAGLISTLPIRIVYVLTLVAIANDKRLASSSLQGILGGLLAIGLLGVFALAALKFFNTRVSIAIGIAAWILAVTIMALASKSS